MMAQNKGLNELLKWSIENSTTTPTGVTSSGGNNNNDTAAQDTGAQAQAPRNLDPELLAQLLGGPSDAELMQAAVAHVVAGETDGEVTLESRLTALDNLEQLVESLDNANLLGPLGLWTPLLGLLGHAEPALRRMAAWCVGTAVQNNAPAQERLLAHGGVERLVAMAVGERVPFYLDGATAPTPAAEPNGQQQEKEGEVDNKETTAEKEHDRDVRRKAVYALSSAVRNYQPALDVCARELRRKGEGDRVPAGLDATDMEVLNALMDGLKQEAMNS